MGRYPSFKGHVPHMGEGSLIWRVSRLLVLYVTLLELSPMFRRLTTSSTVASSKYLYLSSSGTQSVLFLYWTGSYVCITQYTLCGTFSRSTFQSFGHRHHISPFDIHPSVLKEWHENGDEGWPDTISDKAFNGYCGTLARESLAPVDHCRNYHFTFW